MAILSYLLALLVFVVLAFAPMRPTFGPRPATGWQVPPRRNPAGGYCPPLRSPAPPWMTDPPPMPTVRPPRRKGWRRYARKNRSLLRHR